MIKKIQNPISFLMMLLLFFLVSCDSEEASVIDTENFTDSAIENIQNRTVGINHCLEFVFPISIEFIDGSTAQASDYENLHETIATWFTENEVEKTKENKPTLVFPLEVVTEDGEVLQLETIEELKALRSECKGQRGGKKGKRGKRGRGFKCFDLVFPISVIIDGETLGFDSRSELKEAIKAYKQEAGNEAQRPELVFPITIEYDDETQVEVSSQEELQALKEACREENE